MVAEHYEGREMLPANERRAETWTPDERTDAVEHPFDVIYHLDWG